MMNGRVIASESRGVLTGAAERHRKIADEHYPERKIGRPRIRHDGNLYTALRLSYLRRTIPVRARGRVTELPSNRSTIPNGRAL
jgi:hypothetical protein